MVAIGSGGFAAPPDQLGGVQLRGQGLPARDRLPQRARLDQQPPALRGLVELQLPARVWQHERNTICGLRADDETSHTDSGQSRHLRIDPATPGCAAWWLEQAGWHRLGNQPVYATAPGLHRAHTQRETAAVIAASALPSDHALPQQPGPPWP